MDDEIQKLFNKKAPRKTQKLHSKANKTSLGRRKLQKDDNMQLIYIKDKKNRGTTFSKRKKGLLGKAEELSALTGAQISLIIVSENKKVHTYLSDEFKPLRTSFLKILDATNFVFNNNFDKIEQEVISKQQDNREQNIEEELDVETVDEELEMKFPNWKEQETKLRKNDSVLTNFSGKSEIVVEKKNLKRSLNDNSVLNVKKIKKNDFNIGEMYNKTIASASNMDFSEVGDISKYRTEFMNELKNVKQFVQTKMDILENLTTLNNLKQHEKSKLSQQSSVNFSNLKQNLNTEICLINYKNLSDIIQKNDIDCFIIPHLNSPTMSKLYVPNNFEPKFMKNFDKSYLNKSILINGPLKPKQPQLVYNSQTQKYNLHAIIPRLTHPTSKLTVLNCKADQVLANDSKTFENLLTNLVKNCLNVCDKGTVKTIGIPNLYFGRNNIVSEASYCRIICESIFAWIGDRYTRKQKSSIKRIILLTDNTSTNTHFKEFLIQSPLKDCFGIKVSLS